jgi:uncharacterized protein YukJ
MPLKDPYGVLKGHAIDRRTELRDTPHYQVHVLSAGTHFRLAINVLSDQAPSQLEYLIDDNFQHPITAGLLTLSEGFTALAKGPGTLALDFIRGNLFSAEEMRLLPFQPAESVYPLNFLGRGRRATSQERVVARQKALEYRKGRWGE